MRFRPATAVVVVAFATVVTAVTGTPAALAAGGPPPAASGPITHPAADHAGWWLQKHDGVHYVAASAAQTVVRRELAGPDAVPAASTAPLGLDVSDYQGNVNWRAVRSDGAAFAYVKATEGTSYISPYFNQQYTGSYDNGLIRGAYHFALPDRSSGAAQADYFVDHGGGWSADGKTLPGALDIEYNPYGAECYGLSHSAMVRWISQFADEYLARTSVWPVIYSTTDWWRTCTGNYSGFAAYDPLWIACYCTTAGTMPAGWPFETFWQYADSGTFPGDQDLFNGTLAGLEKIALGGTDGPVRSALAGRCMDDYQDAATAGTRVDLWPCNNTAAQNWTVESNGTVRSHGECLDITGASSADGTRVELWPCNGDWNQVWRAQGNGEVRNPGSGKCLDDPGFRTMPGTQLDLWACNDGSNQRWTLP